MTGWRQAALHLGLFAATAVSVGGTHWFISGSPVDEAVLFAGCVVAILGAHELGHFFMARAHRVDASWPYFIPAPLLAFGTLGAVIRLRGRVPTRNALVDIGAAGPLAGMALALPLLVAGAALSHVGPVPQGALEAMQFPASSSLWGLGVRLWHSLGSDAAPAAAGGLYLVYGDNLLVLAVTRLVFGPVPPGSDVFVHPVFLAAWFGMLVTMLNLMPVGQLDGGHLTHAWLGRRAETVGRVVAYGLLALSLVASASWLVWFLVARYVVRLGHPPVVDEAVPLSTGRKVVCLVSLAVGVLTFMPVPMESFTP